jgi:UDP-N-acetylmuramate--alanine ligase
LYLLLNIYNMKLSDFTKIHFIGIGGIGMSALARLFLNEKKVVSGSDRTPSDITHTLETEGVRFFTEQIANNITDDTDLVVYTEAMPKDHEELVRAHELSIPTMNYFDALGMVANEYYLIAVAGSHGKTTTTAMLIDIFENAGLDPTAIVGSLRAKTKNNYRAGKSKYFIVEACEYRRDFMSLNPDILIITNIEHEHVDYYKSLEDVQIAFRELAIKVPKDGYIVANISDSNVQKCLHVSSEVLKMESKQDSIQAHVIDYATFFNPFRTLHIPGIHNQMNAAAAVAAASTIGISVTQADDALAQFSGTWRRFEYKGDVHGAQVYDDYGHHPTEIEATIRGAREMYPHKKIILIFQSHTYSRTHIFFDAFVRSLSLADEVFILPIYSAREENEYGVTHTMLVDALLKKGVKAGTYNTFDDVVMYIKNIVHEHDIVLVMGAGDITEVAKKLVL